MNTTSRSRRRSPNTLIFLTSRCLLRPFKFPAPVLLAIIFLQSFWQSYDVLVTKNVKHKIPKKYPKPTELSPLAPFYSDPYDGPSRAFPKWQHGKFPCGPLIPENSVSSRSVTDEGFLFMKEMKTGSTTLSGITARIARNVAQREYHANNSTACTARLVHTRARRFGERKQDKSFIWSVVREPTARLFSKFYHFSVSRLGVKPSLATFTKFINDNEVNDYAYYLKSLSLRKKMNPYRTDLHDEFVEEMLNGYNFLGVTERMDESLAVLQLLLDLKTSDMLYLSAKTKGSYERFRRSCIQIKETKVTLLMKEYVYSTMFEQFTNPDVLVYRAVNKSLDLTIEELGRDTVDRTVKALQRAQKRVEEKCSNVVKFPCSKDGKVVEPTDCLFGDVACGYKCLDEVGKMLDLEAGRRPS